MLARAGFFCWAAQATGFGTRCFTSQISLWPIPFKREQLSKQE